MKLPRLPHFPKSAFLNRFTHHLRALPPGDKTIVLTLTAVTLFLILAGLYTIERQFLVEVPSHGGGLIEGAVGSPRFINPLLVLSDSDRDLTALTYAGLMGYSADGQLTPVLAESYEISTDGKTYTFIIRPNAKFSDGTPVTSEDVVFTIEKAQDPGLKSPEFANWANIRAEAVDAHTVRFTLPKPYAPFLQDATLGILPAHVWRDVSNEEFPFSPFMEEPVGAGPFRVQNVSRDKNGVVKQYELKAFTDYALGRPYLDSFTFVFFKSQDDLKEAYTRGRVESAYGIPSNHALRAPYSRVFGVFLNPNENPLFSRIEVRKALSLAVNRDTLVREVLGGYGTPLDGPLPPGIGVSSTTAITPADPTAEARAVLEKNGWKFNAEAGVWKQVKGDLTLTVNLKTANIPELRAIADSLRKDWEKLGVSVGIEYYDPSDLAASVIRPRKYDALLFGMVIGRDRDLFAFWSSSERSDPGLNIALYANRSVDTLLETMRSEQDEEKVREDLVKVDTLISADYPAVFTHAPDFLYSVPDSLHGVLLSRITAPSDRLLTAATWYRRTELVWPAFVPVGVKSQ
jgi:peptide/nickel transport system substrate-binding protein